MKELSICLSINDEIREIEERIFEIRSRSMSPKNQIITGMPRGGGSGAVVLVNGIIQVEKLEERKQKLRTILQRHWSAIHCMMCEAGISNEHILLFKFRFFCGMSWNECTDEMISRYPASNWNSNKSFRVYRKIMCKLEKM